MIKLNRYFLGLAAVVMAGFTSCNTDVEGPKYSTSLQSISFDAETAIEQVVPADQTEAYASVSITRAVAAGEVTVPFTAVASEEGIFSNDANGVIKFADGQNVAVINVKAANLEKEHSYTYTLTLDESVVNTKDTIAKPKQHLQYVIKITREGDWTEWKKWNAAGTCDYQYSSVLFGPAEDPDLPFVYRQNLSSTNKYQFKISKWGYGVDFLIDYDAETGVATAKDTYTGYTHASYGEVYINDYNNWYTKRYGSDPASPAYGYFDTEAGIIYIPVSYYVSAGSFGSAYEEVWIDGYTRADLSSSLEYVGVLTNAKGEITAMANLTLGADAESALAVIVGADADPDAVADALAAGELEGLEVTAGTINVPIPEDMTGKLQLVVAVVSNGAVGSVSSVIFEYYGGGANPWKSLGECYFTDDIFYPFFTGAAPQTYKVEIEENSETPGLYRLKSPFAYYASWWAKNGQSGDGAEDIIVNAEDADGVYILNQPIGLTYSSLGSMSFETEGGYYVSLGKYTIATLKQYGMLGSLKDGVITFPVFQETDGDGNPRTDDDGNPLLYQGWLNFSGGKYYTTGNNGAIQIVLPNANPASVAKAKRAAAASDFERRLMSSATSKNFFKKDAKRSLGGVSEKAIQASQKTLVRNNTFPKKK